MKQLSHRKIAGAIGVIAIVALLLVGTFAWSAQINKINEFVGTAADKELAIHDDFNPETGEKAAYVENIGKGVMFVRMRLDEYMDLNKNAPPADIDNHWTTHIPNSTDIDCGLLNDDLDLFHDYFTWEFGGRKYYMPATSGGVYQDIGDYTPDTGEAWLALTPAEQAKVKQTSDFSGDPVITMAAYNALADKAAFIGWVYDTDGYVYWSQPLFEGGITGLLLNRVNTDASIADLDYYYAINVVAEAVDHADLNMWLEGKAASTDSTLFYDEATPDAKAMLSVLEDIKASIDESKVVLSLEIETAPDKVVYTVGEIFDRTGLSIKVNFADGTDTIITSGYSYSPANPLRATHTEVTFKYGGKTVTQAITVNP